MKYSSTVHDLPPAERPRERLVQFGADALSLQELLALILRSGIKGKSVIALSQDLITQFGNIKNIADASVAEISKLPGMGLSKATQLKAACELGKRLSNSVDTEQEIIRNAEDVFNLIKSRLNGKKKEHFLTISVNTRNKVNRLLDVEMVSMGSLDSSIVHPREAFREAISAHASSVIFAHNHPSGNPEPSEDNIKLTKRLIEVGEIVGIEVLDHIIVTDNGYISMKAVNLI
jgi:DNA repair protein RadC